MLEQICKQAIELVKETGTFIGNAAGKVTREQIEVKGKNSLVSFVDKEAEKMLVSGLSKILPDAVYITEEDTVENRDGEWQWIIDPLDGTTNFLHSIPIFSISIALRRKEEIVIGIVYDVVQKELFHAIIGQGAKLNDIPISVSSRNTEDALMATGFPYYNFIHLDKYIAVLKELMKRTRGLRRMGSAAIDLAYVAAGRFDVFFEYGLNPWDVAAGALLVKEAGGTVSDFSNGDKFLFTGQIVAGSDVSHKELIMLIKEHLGENISYL